MFPCFTLRFTLIGVLLALVSAPQATAAGTPLAMQTLLVDALLPAPGGLDDMDASLVRAMIDDGVATVQQHVAWSGPTVPYDRTISVGQCITDGDDTVRAVLGNKDIGLPFAVAMANAHLSVVVRIDGKTASETLGTATPCHGTARASIIAISSHLLRTARTSTAALDRLKTVLLHELIHAVAMMASRATAKSHAVADGVLHVPSGNDMDAGITGRGYFDVPGLTEEMRAFFGCPSLPGFPMTKTVTEGTADAFLHVDPSLFFGTAMTPFALYGNRVAWTDFAHLRFFSTVLDIDVHGLSDPPVGRGLGCDFARRPPSDVRFVRALAAANTLATADSVFCSPDGLFSQKIELSATVGGEIVTAVVECLDATPRPSMERLLQVTGASSRCLPSSLDKPDVAYRRDAENAALFREWSGATCFPLRCIGPAEARFRVGNRWTSCDGDADARLWAQPRLSGTTACPPVNPCDAGASVDVGWPRIASVALDDDVTERRASTGHPCDGNVPFRDRDGRDQSARQGHRGCGR